jgi:predicted tellurium resistance membrane protein TerC
MSIAMMALAATAIAKALESYRWIGYVGLAIILWVAGEMIYYGAAEVNSHLL